MRESMRSCAKRKRACAGRITCSSIWRAVPRSTPAISMMLFARSPKRRRKRSKWSEQAFGFSTKIARHCVTRRLAKCCRRRNIRFTFARSRPNARSLHPTRSAIRARPVSTTITTHSASPPSSTRPSAASATSPASSVMSTSARCGSGPSKKKTSPARSPISSSSPSTPASDAARRSRCIIVSNSSSSSRASRRRSSTSARRSSISPSSMRMRSPT